MIPETALRELPTRPRLILFDYDGTLIDTETADSEILSRRLREAGADCSPEAVLRLFTGLARSEIPAAVRRIFGLELPPEWLPAYVAELHEAELLSPVIPGVGEFFSFLARSGIRHGLATNSRGPRIGRMLDATGLRPLFGEHAYHLDLGCRMKPEPDLFLFGAKTEGVSPADTWVIEDSALGIEGGLRAGMPCVGMVAFNPLGKEHEEELLAAGAFALADSLAALRELIEAAPEPGR